MNIATKKKSTDKNAAASVTTRGQSANVANAKSDQTNQWKESQVAKMRPQEYSKNEESIMAAIQSGNFIYDVTRGGN
jgi:beta-lactamase superfamily II metal-dependent hydrolase